MCKINLNQKTILSIHHADLGNGFTETVNAEELHQFLEVKAHFKDWIDRRIESLGLEQGLDYHRSNLSSGENQGLSRFMPGANKKEVWLTIEAAKHISMAERNEKGRQARKYFIQVENKAQEIIPQLQAKINQQRTQLANLSDALLDTNPLYSKIVRYTQLGLIQKEIAKLCDVSGDTIRNHQQTLANLGIVDTYQGKTTAIEFSQAQLADMANQRLNGATYVQIARQYNCVPNTISRHLTPYLQGMETAQQKLAIN